MADTKVALVVGDVMLDKTTHGEMTRISPEGPIPIVRQVGSVTYVLGGAGNVAANIVSLGHSAMLLGAVGADEAGSLVQSLASVSGISACLPQKINEPTTVKHRVVCDGQAVLRVDTEPAVSIGHPHQLLFEGFDAAFAVAGLQLVVIADYAKGAMTAEFAAHILAKCRERCVPVFVDCRAESVAWYAGASLLKPNCREAVAMLPASVHPGLAASTDSSQVAAVACQLLAQTYNVSCVVVTDGSRGCHHTAATPNELPQAVPAITTTVVDSCGAGDTTMAALAVAFLEGKPLPEACDFAMAAASYVVQFSGTTLAHRDAVEEFIYKNSHTKLMPLDVAAKCVAGYRRRRDGAVVVLANGCFDGFHAGHLETLRYAKQQGDLLVVAYNNDTSLRELKGEGRPHVPEHYRAMHLADQLPVDIVTSFDGDIRKVVRAIRPDVLVKGGDTPSNQVPGADDVAAYGGRVAFCPIDSFYVTVDRQSSFNPASGDKANG